MRKESAGIYGMQPGDSVEHRPLRTWVRRLVKKLLRALGLACALASVAQAQQIVGLGVHNSSGTYLRGANGESVNAANGALNVNSAAGTSNVNIVSTFSAGNPGWVNTGSTVPVAQYGTWTVQPGNTANTTAWLARLPQFSRSDTYTTTANGTTADASAAAARHFGVLVKGTGSAATVWDVRLECSLDNSNFTQLIQHTNTDGDGANKFSGSSIFPCLYFRSRVAGLTLGTATNIVVTIVGLQ